MSDAKTTKTPTPLTRADIEKIAAEADARMGRVAGKLRAVLLIAAAALGTIVTATLYLGLIVIASVLIAVCLVTVTLYLFVRLWPGAGPAAKPSPVPAPATETTPLAVAEAEVEAPKHRILWALREMAQRQDDFRISGRAAERFARTIRFVMKSEK
jgi:hypothetical protein